MTAHRKRMVKENGEITEKDDFSTLYDKLDAEESQMQQELFLQQTNKRSFMEPFDVEEEEDFFRQHDKMVQKRQRKMTQYFDIEAMEESD